MAKIIPANTNSKKFKKMRNISFVVLVVIVVGGVFYGIWAHQKSERDKKQQQANLAMLDNKSFALLKQQSTQLAAENQFDTAATGWLNYAAHTTSRTHAGIAYVNAATAYLNEGQYAKALDAAKKSEAIQGMTYAETQVAAIAEAKLKDYSAAISYTRQSITLMPSTISDPVTQKQQFNLAIKNLQAKL